MLTVYGIETNNSISNNCFDIRLQQCLPFTVLKLSTKEEIISDLFSVATVLTVYGIETNEGMCRTVNNLNLVATVLTVYGIETSTNSSLPDFKLVATVLTVYGIETVVFGAANLSSVMLQQCLPFTVLKPNKLANTRRELP